MYGPVHTYSPPLAPGPRTERPGAGLALAAAGIVLGLLCLLALPWAEGGGETATFMDIRDAVSGAPDPTDIVTEVGWWYLSWAAFTAFAVVVGLALMATIGLRSGATTVARTLCVVAALGACGVHYMGVWQMFSYQGEAADSGPLLTYVAYALLLVGGALGPRTAASVPAMPIMPPMPAMPTMPAMPGPMAGGAAPVPAAPPGPPGPPAWGPPAGPPRSGA